MSKTIKELSQELGISKQAVWQRIKRNPLLQKVFNEHSKTVNGTVFVDKTIEELIKKTYPNQLNNINFIDVNENIDDNKLKKSSIDNNKLIETLQNAMKTLQEQLSIKDNQIEKLTSILKSSQIQIETLTNALTAAQALHAGTIKERLSTDQPDSTEEELEKEPEKEEKGFFSIIFKKNK